MILGSSCRLRCGAGVLAVTLAAVSGCTPASPLAGAGVSLAPPEGWRAVSRTTWPVPGSALAAWSGPGGASLAVYRTLANPGGRAADVVTEVATRYENLPGMKVVAQRVETIGGLEAARIEAVAPGMGEALAATGLGVPSAPPGKSLVPTRRVLLAILRASDTIWLVWHAPEAEASTLATQVEATLKTLKLDRGTLANTSY